MMNKVVTVVIVFACWLVICIPGVAASTVSVRFCFVIETDYSDMTDGDYWTSGYYRVAYGIHAKVAENGGSTVFYGWTSASTSCTSYLSLDTTKSYYIRLTSRSRDSNDNIIHVYSGYSGSTHLYQTVDNDYQPTANATVVYTYEMKNPVHETNILAAAAFAVREHPAGLSGHNFYIYSETSGGGAYHSNGYIYLDQTCRNAKTGTTHELGHLIGWKKDGNQSVEADYTDFLGGDCATQPTEKHKIYSREWQTAAASEGNAHFYAAATWNDNSEYDCAYRYKDCEGGNDYYVDWLDHCDNPLTDRGNELDWLRFWWDLHTDASLTVGDIYDIWDDANPHDWVPSSVYKRLREAAADNGVSNGTWDYWGGYNGVDHGTWP